MPLTALTTVPEKIKAAVFNDVWIPFINGLETSLNGVSSSLSSKAPTANPTFTGTVSGVTKAHVGLNNVDNTSDATKPVSSATQTALDGKAASVHTHTSSAITDFISAVDTRIQNIVGAAPAALDTLAEIATRIESEATDLDALIGTVSGKAPLVHTHVKADITNLDPVAQAATPSTVVMRWSSGAISIADPINPDNASTKGYVDGVKSDLQATITTATANKVDKNTYLLYGVVQNPGVTSIPANPVAGMLLFNRTVAI